MHAEATPTSVEKLGDGRVAVTTDKGERIEADAVMFGTGRNPNTKVGRRRCVHTSAHAHLCGTGGWGWVQNLGLEAVGVQLDKRGGIVVRGARRT